MTNESARAAMPFITVDSVDSVHNSYINELGFTRVMGVAGPDGQLSMVTLTLDGARLMFARPRGKIDGTQPALGKRPVDVYLEVADVDAYHTQLKKRAVNISDPLTLQWWGDKTFKVLDPNGYEIWFYQKVGAPKPPQGMKIV